jgi:hypothetical protein
MKPGNAGGGKDPDFWCARDDGDAGVIGLWPANTKIKWPDPSERAVSRGEDVRASCAYAVCNGRDIVGLTVKPVGKPDAGNPHVRFDERGRETERCRMAQATAPFLDSTIPRSTPSCPGLTGHAYLGSLAAAKNCNTYTMQ